MLKTACRLVLVALTPPLGYAALDPEFQTSHFIPHYTHFVVDTPYAWVLWLEQNVGQLAHLFTVWLFMILIPCASLFGSESRVNQRWVTVVIMIVTMCLIESFQWLTGRGIDISDWLFNGLGLLGGIFSWWSYDKYYSKA